MEKDKVESVFHQVNKFDKAFAAACSVVMWQSFLLSSLIIVFTNFIFWLIIYLDFKFCGTIFIFLLIITLAQLWTDELCQYLFKGFSIFQEETSEHGQSKFYMRTSDNYNYAEKVQVLIKNVYHKMLDFRHRNHAGFCGLACICFLLLKFFGNYISAVTLLYILFMLILTVPGLALHFFPPQIIGTVSNKIFSYFTGGTNENFYASASSENDEMESFIPETTQEALEVLRLAGEVQYSNKSDEEDSSDSISKGNDAGISDDSESISSNFSFYPDLPQMPTLDQGVELSDSDLPLESLTQITDNYKLDNQAEENSSEEDFELKVKDAPKKEKKAAKAAKHKVYSGKQTLLTDENTAENVMQNKKEHLSDSDSFEMISEEEF